MTLDEFNALTDLDAQKALLACCGSSRWADQLAQRRPFTDLNQMELTAEEVWWSLHAADWMEAFAKHPRIGEQSAVSTWSLAEQSGMLNARPELLEGIAELNREYLHRFGFLFIVCATGKTAEEMHEILKERLENGPAEELRIAAGEQAKITALRLRKMLAGAPGAQPHPKGISTHVLDTASGHPASDVPVRLYRGPDELGAAITDHDGRCPKLLPEGVPLSPGVYRLVFDVVDRYPNGFYPEVSISFTVRGLESHYHIPLLLSPFGYTTYRGS